MRSPKCTRVMRVFVLLCFCLVFCCSVVVGGGVEEKEG